MPPKTTQTVNELKANMIVRSQQINDINESLKKLDNRQCTDGTAVRILEQARWTLSQERNDFRFELEKRPQQEAARS